jgi:hypothetical protein
MAPPEQGLHAQAIGERFDRRPFADEVQPVPALFPDADRVSDQQGANPPGIISRQHLPRGERPKPLQRQIRGRAICDTDTMPQAEIEHRRTHDGGAGNILLVPGEKDAA